MVPDFLPFAACHGGDDRKYKVVERKQRFPTTRSTSASRTSRSRRVLLQAQDGAARHGHPACHACRSTARKKPWHGRGTARRRPHARFHALHFHENWRVPEYRRIFAQGILWTLKLPIPEKGLAVDVTDEELKLKAPIRVLFVGNSQVYYNDLPAIVEALADSAPGDRSRIRTERAVAGGASLESHWTRGTGKGTPRARIAEEKWDYVILQEIFNGKPESFNKHGRLFHDLIRQNGAQTVLLSTASINTLYPKGFQELHDMHVALGKELKVPVAGRQRLAGFLGQEPHRGAAAGFYDKDKAHPGKKGSCHLRLHSTPSSRDRAPSA